MRQTSGVSRVASIPIRLLMVCLLCFTIFATVDNIDPGDPPVAPGRVPGSRVVETVQPAANEWIYLPLVQRAPAMSVNPQDRQASLHFFLEHYQNAPDAPVSWTGDHSTCAPGVTGLGFQQAITRRINYFRAMAGVPAEVTLSTDSTRKAQAAALMMSANGQLSHSPPPTWTCLLQ